MSCRNEAKSSNSLWGQWNAVRPCRSGGPCHFFQLAPSACCRCTFKTHCFHDRIRRAYTGYDIHARYTAKRKANSSKSLLMSPSSLLLRTELSDTPVYEPYIQARLETVAHFCEAASNRLWGIGGLPSEKRRTASVPYGDRATSLVCLVLQKSGQQPLFPTARDNSN